MKKKLKGRIASDRMRVTNGKLLEELRELHGRVGQLNTRLGTVFQTLAEIKQATNEIVNEVRAVGRKVTMPGGPSQ